MRKLIDEATMMRTIRRISHEIIERNRELNDLVLLGVKNNGVPLAKRIKDNILAIEHVDVPVYPLDITGYRDDMTVDEFQRLEIDLTGKIVVIIDDVLYTGRTVRASMDAIVDLGRPATIQLAVLIDRGHRELPIRADYVGKNLPTSSKELVHVAFEGEQGVYLTTSKEIGK